MNKLTPRGRQVLKAYAASMKTTKDRFEYKVAIGYSMLAQQDNWTGLFQLRCEKFMMMTPFLLTQLQERVEVVFEGATEMVRLVDLLVYCYSEENSRFNITLDDKSTFNTYQHVLFE